MSGGIGESMLIGAAVGGGTALVTGNDPLQGALLGGVTGGISGAVGGAGAGAIGGGAAAGGAGASTAATQASNALGTNLATAAIPNAATQAATQAVTQATNAGITGLAPTDVFGLANYTGQVAPNFATQAVADTVSAPMLQAATPQSLAAAGDIGEDLVRQFGGDATAGITNQVADKGMLGKFGDWYGGLGTGEKIGYGIAGGVALQGLMGGLGQQPQIKPEEEEENPFGLATYDRRAFTPYVASPNVYRPSYANGGIASLPLNRNYPQALQKSAQYATPTQMPVSAELMGNDYGAPIDTYTGEPISMADGGSLRDAVARYMSGMNPASNPTVPTPTRSTPQSTPVVDPSVIESRRAAAERAELLAQQQAMFRSGMGGKGIGSSPIYRGGPLGMNYNPIDPYNQRLGFQQPAPVPNDYIAKDFSPVVSRTANTNIYRPQFAKGGIAGEGHLGDYAAGGMPRLLRGPGDGVSDDIPATIAGKQPARLADGEFVIPARIVSEIGNGSTDAGAKRLYAMMDRVQKKRGKSVGKNKVAVDSQAYKELAKV